MAEYINRKILADLVLSKLKFMGDARIMNQNDEKVLSEIDGYEKAITDVHELILDKDLIEDVQPVKHGKWITVPGKYGDKFLCSNCGTAEITESGEDGAVWYHDEYCRKCGARMDGDTND